MADELTPQQQELVKQLKAAVAPKVQRYASLRYFANEHTYVRYLRARSWNFEKALKMLQATLDWRLENKPHELRWDKICHEAETGKMYLYHITDKAGRPIILMRPGLENTKDSETRVLHLIYILDVVSRLADRTGVGKMMWLLDFWNYSMKTAPSISTQVHCNNILMNHFPERLGCAICYHAPSLFSLAWKAVSPFIDPVTKTKICFVDKGPDERQEMEARLDMSQMEKCIGGEIEGYIFNYEKYAKKMRELDREMEAEYLAVVEEMKKEGVDPEPSPAVVDKQHSHGRSSLDVQANSSTEAHKESKRSWFSRLRD